MNIEEERVGNSYFALSNDDIDSMVRAYLGDCGPQATRVYSFARAIWSVAQTDSQCYSYAKRLAESLWRKHYKETAPAWEACEDLMGVLTQIDNMVCGLTSATPNAPAQDNDFPLGSACDLSGEGHCTACERRR